MQLATGLYSQRFCRGFHLPDGWAEIGISVHIGRAKSEMRLPMAATQFALTILPMGCLFMKKPDGRPDVTRLLSMFPPMPGENTSDITQVLQAI